MRHDEHFVPVIVVEVVREGVLNVLCHRNVRLKCKKNINTVFKCFGFANIFLEKTLLGMVPIAAEIIN